MTDVSGNYVLEDAEPGISYRIVFGHPSVRVSSSSGIGGPISTGVPTAPGRSTYA